MSNFPIILIPPALQDIPSQPPLPPVPHAPGIPPEPQPIETGVIVTAALTVTVFFFNSVLAFFYLP
ncbi:MAG: hypothetical protein HC919_10440 [Oscillatoriales cyanobacterium SM2_2_1]|nr:hypothetical protein [Oscillatoriales cyanobacterium SM2_2_1]